jgi:hypothetical protein
MPIQPFTDTDLRRIGRSVLRSEAFRREERRPEGESPTPPGRPTAWVRVTGPRDPAFGLYPALVASGTFDVASRDFVGGLLACWAVDPNGGDLDGSGLTSYLGTIEAPAPDRKLVFCVVNCGGGSGSGVASGSGTGDGDGEGSGSGSGASGSGGGHEPGTVDTTCCSPTLLPATARVVCLSGCGGLAGMSTTATYDPTAMPPGWRFALDDGAGDDVQGWIACTGVGNYPPTGWALWGSSQCTGEAFYSYTPNVFANQTTDPDSLSCDPLYVQINLFLTHAVIALMEG